jgi:hypothetical protein
MKKIKITFFVLCISILSVAQVGIGTNTPVSSAILELKATDKSLLLTRVATTAAVTTPVNGMMVYDISSNCIKGYQNGAWTGCLSSCGTASTPPNYGASRNPCAALADIRDFCFTNNSFGSYSYPMFISGDGFVYGGWDQDLYGMTGLGNVYSGDASSTYAYSSNDLFSAYPAANILYHLPNARWKRIMGTSSSGNVMFGITEEGKMYSWGGTNGTTWPIYGVLTTFSNRTQSSTPREIINPDGNQWKEFYCTGEYVYAVDHTGKWWSWGGRTSMVFNAISFAHTPTATSTYYLAPRACAALVPAPKYNPNIEETFAAFQGGNAVCFAYIATDNKVYTYGENAVTYSGSNITTPQLINLPAGVTPKKIMTFMLSNFLILGDNGVIYRFGNGESYIPATGTTAVPLNTGAYLFKDFVIGSNAIHGVQLNGGNMVNISYNFSNANIQVVQTKVIAGTSAFNIVKLWRDNQEDIFIKDGTTGNIYTYNTVGNMSTTTWITRAVGFKIPTVTGSNVDTNGAVLNNVGPFKLINCQN